MSEDLNFSSQQLFIVHEPESPHYEIWRYSRSTSKKQLLQNLQVRCCQVDLGRVQSKLDGLQAPASGPPDPVSKLWPQHMSPEVSQQLAARSGLVPAPAGAASSQQAGRLQHRFPTFFEQYGYS